MYSLLMLDTNPFLSPFLRDDGMMGWMMPAATAEQQ
jgi:hypothetical protein